MRLEWNSAPLLDFSFLMSLGASVERSKAFTLMMTGCHSTEEKGKLEMMAFVLLI